MIKDELEYQVSQEWVEKFTKTMAAMERDEEAKRKDFLKWDAGRRAIQCHLDQLHEEIAEYERLINCDKSQPIQIVVENFNKLPDALIKARIAAKMSEKELAEMLGIDEQRIKEHEAKNYRYASFLEILEISFALGVEFKTAVVQVDFEQVEELKQGAKEWHKERRERARKKSQIVAEQKVG
ncbi:MAG TPA: DNA-binding protein [Cyanobacteria bacterium UBA11149]|nr:DNA-binding protein [Cyanobacteria bacterium UBA11367]HBE59507.1 DNA-binding protein [Cyanobacteria bacterium UBA11366]HBR76854.1 DNA-binding protein [Cyanobacteria bacterium UBA11159]HBS67692.1 DNA-binding protein [Cyanobacteria bacterium UBA11153]HBW90358.1 DNA-binding protein [Cyanobacteria bacterium UBA11149]HCA93249.1 DNA-binding protein [Cyanobacteria bacterium UBA9226]